MGTEEYVQYDMLGLEYEVKGVSGSYSANRRDGNQYTSVAGNFVEGIISTG